MMAFAGVKRGCESEPAVMSKDEDVWPTCWHRLLADVEGVVLSFLSFRDVTSFSLTCRDFYHSRQHHIYSVRELDMPTTHTHHLFRRLTSTVVDNEGKGAPSSCVREMRSLKRLRVYGPSERRTPVLDSSDERNAADDGNAVEGQASTNLVVLKNESLSYGLSRLTAFFPRLSRLSLPDCMLGLTGAEALADGIRSMASLSAVDLRHNKLDSQAFAMLNESLSLGCPLLSELLLENNHVQADGILNCKAPLPSQLRVLNLRDNELGMMGVAALASRLERGECPSLSHLHLAINSITSEGAEALAAAMPGLPRLAYLELSCNKLTHYYTRANGVRALMASLRHCPLLETLLLDDTDLGPGDMRSLSNAIQAGSLSSLTHLNLAENCLRAKGITHLSAALSSRAAPAGLSHLHLDGCGMDDDVAPAFLHALRAGVNGLRSLSLRGNEIGDAAACALADMLSGKAGKPPLSRLEVLGLDFTNVGDAGMQALVIAFRRGACPSLRTLKLACCKVGNRAMHSLAACLLTTTTAEPRALPLLSQVDARHTNVVPSEKLRRARALVQRARPQLQLLCGDD